MLKDFIHVLVYLNKGNSETSREATMSFNKLHIASVEGMPNGCLIVMDDGRKFFTPVMHEQIVAELDSTYVRTTATA